MTKLRKKPSKFLILISFILTLALTVTMADFCSNLITINSASNASQSNGQSSYSIYGISLFTATTKTTALEHASSLQKQSGAGYVLEQNKKFYVLASAYAEENDAKLVKTNLETEGLSPEIIKITIPPITLNGNYNTTEMNALVGAITIYKTVFDNLYDISVALDTKISTQAECLLFISDVDNLVSKAKLNFDALFNSNQTTEILYIKLSLADLCKKTEALKNFQQSSSQTLSSKIKTTYLETVDLNLNLAKSI